MNHGWQSEATDGPRAAKREESAKRKKSADRSGKYFSTPETWTVECNCRRIFANIWFSQVWKHSSYTYAIPWCFKIWAWLRHEFLETAIPWWFTSKFWPRHELGMSLSFDCRVLLPHMIMCIVSMYVAFATKNSLMFQWFSMVWIVCC